VEAYISGQALVDRLFFTGLGNEALSGITMEDFFMVAIDPKRREMIDNLFAMVTAEIGHERWTQVLNHLITMEEETGGILRRLPRGSQRQGKKEIETCPMLLFAPDTDRDGMTFALIEDGTLVYERDGHPSLSRKYPVYPPQESIWWSNLPSHAKGITISALGYMLLSLGLNGRFADLVAHMETPPSHTLTDEHS